MYSRRKFLQQGTLAALVCAGPIKIWSAGRNNPGNSPSQVHITGKAMGLNRQQFVAAVGSSFMVVEAGNTQPVFLQLAAVSDLPALVPVNLGSMAVPPPTPSRAPVTTEGFMLSFTGGPSDGLAQGTYVFENATLGQFRLFIVPEGITPQTYVAVFNQVEAAALTSVPSQLPGRSRPGIAPGGGSTSGNAGFGSAGSGNASGSGAGEPTQEPPEPVFGHSLKSKLPE